MLIEPLQVSPGATAVLGRCYPFPTSTYRIHLPCGLRQHRFETDITFPVRAKVIHIPTPLAAMQAEVPQPNTARRWPTAAVFSAMDMKIVQMLITPGKQDLQKRMQVREGHITLDKHPAPDEWTNASEDDAELVDTERCGRGCHALRVLQRSVLLKGSPRYLALSNFFADAIAYQRVPGDHPDMYRQIHQRLHDNLVQLRTALGQQDPPLVIIAHSLGSVIMSNYIWDEQTQHGLGTTPLT